jgi:hypothetical protein
MFKFRSTASGFVVVAAGALAFTAAPAMAGDPKPGEAPQPPAVAKSEKTKYCVVSEITGSRMPRKTCKTRDQWLAQGFDPVAPEAK